MTRQDQINPVEESFSGFLRLPQILKIIPVGRSTWWHWVAIGKAPKPLKLGPKTTVWRMEDINQFIEQVSDGKLRD